MPQKQRLLSVDALRGFDMVWILGAEGIFAALFGLTGWTIFSVAEQQMLHSQWHGFTAYDLIFPLFIFLSGVSIGYSQKRLIDLPAEKIRLKQLGAIKRLLLLFSLGIIYNHGWGIGMPNSLDDIRFASVLARIGIAWFIVTLLIWHTSLRTQGIFAVAILLGYWLLLAGVRIENFGVGDFSPSGAVNVWFDQTFLPGRTYQKLALDPEGLLSNIPSVINALVGAFIGRYILLQQYKPYLLIKHLLFFAGCCLAVGYGWDLIFPINKTLWTSSFVLVSCGYSVLLLTLFYYIIDVLKRTFLATFFVVIGSNSIFAYLGTSLIDWRYTVQSLFGQFIDHAGAVWQPLWSVLALIMVQWALLYWLYHRNIFIRV